MPRQVDSCYRLVSRWEIRWLIRYLNRSENKSSQSCITSNFGQSICFFTVIFVMIQSQKDMAQHEPVKQLSREDRIFEENMQRGDDFFKIEIFRSAKAWYQKALEMNLEQDLVRKCIAECDRLLKYERKVFSILGIVAAGILIVGLAIFL